MHFSAPVRPTEDCVRTLKEELRAAIEDLGSKNSRLLLLDEKIEEIEKLEGGMKRETEEKENLLSRLESLESLKEESEAMKAELMQTVADLGVETDGNSERMVILSQVLP